MEPDHAAAELPEKVAHHAKVLAVQAAHHDHLAQQIADLVLRLADGDRRMQRIENGLADNTSITTEVRDLMAAAKAGMRVLGWLGTAARWAGYLAAAALSIYTAIYAATHGGDLPGGR